MEKLGGDLAKFGKQAENGPSWCHILGSKIAKGLQSIKYSLLQYPNEKNVFRNFFRNFFEVSGMSQSAENVKRGIV